MTKDLGPNLLYIHSDQHNPYVTGCYGDGVVQTPALDRLAAEGALFSNAYCPSPICVPSRMSTLAGQHPHRTHVWTNDHCLSSGIPTFAHALGAAGYRPVLIGRMHAMGPDQLHGYAERLVGDHSTNYVGGTGVRRGLPPGTAGPHRISLEASGAGRSGYQVHDEAVIASALAFIDGQGRAAGNDPGRAPFCLTVGLMLPHPPYVAEPADFRLYEGRVPPPRIPAPPLETLHPHIRWRMARGEILETDPDDVARARAAYWALVSRMDRMIGQLLDALDANGLAQNTLVVYSSDHGDSLGERGLWWKHTFYEESVKVPLIARWPGRIAPGQQSDRVVSSLDLTATLVDALEAPALPNTQGRSLLPLLEGVEDADWDDLAFSEYCDDLFGPPGGCYQRMVRRGDWKLIVYHGEPSQLFNLAEDPDEVHDRAADPACRDIVEELAHSVHADWDPIQVIAEMRRIRADNKVLADWTKAVQPVEQIRWELTPEMEYLASEM